MNKKFDINENSLQDMSIEEFDAIDAGLERHKFSDKYTKRKEQYLKNYRKEMLGFTSRGFVKVAVAAAVLIIATPVSVNAATNGELFQRLWGNAGKKTTSSYEQTFVEEEKLDDNGKPSEYSVTIPKAEYVEADTEKAEELIGKNIASEPTVIKMGDTTMTVMSVTRDKNGIVAEYTLEKEGGVDCLNYSDLDNMAKGAWFNEDQNLMFAFREGSGKIYVDLEKSTEEKLYCYEYMVDNRAGFYGAENDIPKITDHLTLDYTLYNLTRSEVCAKIEESGDLNFDETPYITEEKSVNIPVSEEIETTVFTSKDGGNIEISPIAMNVDMNKLESDTDEASIDTLYKMEIVYKDGSNYLITDKRYPYDTGSINDVEEEVESFSYICGSLDNHVITLFNRLVDVDQIDHIRINGTDYTVK